MATAYIDVKTEPGIEAIPQPTATSTVTNHVRVAWDTSLDRGAVARTLEEIGRAIIDGNRFDGTNFGN